MNITTRQGVKEDIPSVFELVKELAVFERALHMVSNNVDKMKRDYDEKLFDFHVAEVDAGIVGISLYYFRYSTWRGKMLYMEDIIVTEKQRGKGLGKLLFDKVLEISKEKGCSGMVWQVLDWNEPAIKFYKNYGAAIEDGWLNASVTHHN